MAMIIGRIVFAGSKLALSNCTDYSSLWEICGIQSEIDVNTHCYDAMDKLFKRQEAIQQSLAKKHLYNGTIVLYDLQFGIWKKSKNGQIKQSNNGQ
jgi:hypothetical protein